MLDLSLPKIMVILTVALFVLGPERLPAMMRQAGRWIAELRRLRESVESEVRSVLDPLSDPGPGGTPANPLAGMESPFAGLHESVSSIGDSLRAALGSGSSAPSTGQQKAMTGRALPETDLRRELPPPGQANRTAPGAMGGKAVTAVQGTDGVVVDAPAAGGYADGSTAHSGGENGSEAPLPLGSGRQADLVRPPKPKLDPGWN